MFSACAKRGKNDKQDAAVAQPAPAVAPAPAPAKPTVQAKQTLAKRCVLGGDPLASDCVRGGEGVAFGADGTFYIVDGKHVRRYMRADGGDCRFEPSGESIALPPDNPRPQSIDGPVYMRSGGAAWHLTRAGDAVYAHDFLGGLFRIDRGNAEPACVDVFGYASVAVLGKRLLVSRKGIEELKLGKKCKAVPAKIDDKARDKVYVVRDKVYTAAGRDVHRYDDGKPVKLAEQAKICYATAMTACGEGACVLDSNCFALIQLDEAGNVMRKIDDDQLFATRPYGLSSLVTGATGAVYVLGRHRDKVNDKEICEAAVYELPAAVFAR